MSLYIDTRIVYEPNKKGEKDNFSELGYAYNRAMKTVEDWVLFLDQDIYLCNRDWYSICLNAVKEVGYKAGWITAVTNRIGNSFQGVKGLRTAPDDLTIHDKISQIQYKKYGNTIEDITDITHKLGGFFILTHKKAWHNAGGFNEERRSGFDKDYCLRILAAGYSIYRLPGLYVYHSCWRNYNKIPGTIEYKNTDYEI